MSLPATGLRHSRDKAYSFVRGEWHGGDGAVGALARDRAVVHDDGRETAGDLDGIGDTAGADHDDLAGDPALTGAGGHFADDGSFVRPGVGVDAG